MADRLDVPGHAKWCPRKTELANMSGNFCSTCGEKIKYARGGKTARKATNHQGAVDEVARLRAGLERIASAESGVWGQIAHETLCDRCACGRRGVCVSVDCPENGGLT